MTTINLDDAQKAFIDKQIERGTYRSVEDVIAAGLRLLESKEEQVAELRQQIDEADRQIADNNIIEVHNAEDFSRSIIDRGTRLLGKRG